MYNTLPQAMHIKQTHKSTTQPNLLKEHVFSAHRLTNKKARKHNKLYMAGGGFSGLTSQTSCPLSCGSDRISFRNPARPHTSDRYRQVSKQTFNENVRVKIR